MPLSTSEARVAAKYLAALEENSSHSLPKKQKEMEPTEENEDLDEIFAGQPEELDSVTSLTSSRARWEVESGIDVTNERYPYSIVWSPLPMITCFLPVVGHMGITDSRGVIYDFAGPYHIGEGCMAFGAPTRYLQLDPKLCKEMKRMKEMNETKEIKEMRFEL